MRVKVSPIGWVILIVIIAFSILLGVILGRTNYIPDICNNLKKEYPEPITLNHPAYSKYLDSNNNNIACD